MTGYCGAASPCYEPGFFVVSCRWRCWAAQPRPNDRSTEELLRRIDALQRRVEELEGKQPKVKSRTATNSRAGSPAANYVPAAKGVYEPLSIGNAPVPQPASHSRLRPAAEPTSAQWGTEDALRSDLPGLSIRIPGTASEVRLYGFAKVSAYTDFNGRNQTDAPAPSAISLKNSPADLQGGDFGMTARFSRIGVDTRTLTNWLSNCIPNTLYYDVAFRLLRKDPSLACH